VSGRSGFQIRQVLDASCAWTRIVARVDHVANQRIEAHPRGAKAVIDQRTAARLSAVVGDGEFPEHAAVADGGRAPEKPQPAAPQGRIAPVTAGIAALACSWAGARANHDFGNTVAHAAAAGGSFGAPTAAAGPMFGASRDPGEAGGDPAMTPKNSARVAAVVVAAAVTANGALAGDAVQWRVEDGGNGHWYRVSEQSFASWSLAVEAANAVGGYLATFTSSAEWARRPSTSMGCFIGGYQDPLAQGYSEPSGGWRWVTGEPWAFAPWVGSEPDDAPCYIDNGPGQQDVIWIGSASGNEGFSDIESAPLPYCSWDNHAAIIEWSADCNSDGIVDYGQILAGTLVDTNSNGVPDTCECATNPSLPSCCPGDIYRNDRVDGADLGALLSEWGPVTPLTNSDIDGNGQVNGADLGILLAHWGPCGG
jgi:hypothetical protein